jgi:lysozyme
MRIIYRETRTVSILSRFCLRRGPSRRRHCPRNHLRPCTDEELKTKVGAAEVEAAFASRIAEAERAIRRNVSRQTLNQNQFDALVSFVYNVGAHGAKATFKRVDAGDFQAAAMGIAQSNKMWIKTKHGPKLVLARGLIQRREEESAPFRTTAK